MSTPQGSIQDEQLLELLLQLKKTTPDQARAILSSQPAIAYGLINIMIKMNAVNVDVLQRTVASFSAPGSSIPLPPPPLPPHASTTPPHLAPLQNQSQYATPPPPPSQPQPGYPPQLFSHSQPQPHTPNLHSNGSGFNQPPPNPYGGYQGIGGNPIEATLAAIPEDQRAAIMHVIQMTPEQIAMLPPQERVSVVQLRATLGIPG